MKNRSLVRRATAAVLGMELLSGMAFATAALLHEREVRWHALETMLSGRADSLIGAVQDAEDPQNNVKVDPDEFQPGRDDEYAVYNPAGQLIGGSENTAAAALQPREGLQNSRDHGHSYRVLQRRALRIIDRGETGGEGRRRPVTVVYAIRTDRLWHQVFEATQFYLLLCLASVVVTAVLLILLARRLLFPLRELAVAAGSIEPGSLTFETPPSAVETTELRPLAEALQRMITRVRSAFEAEKQFFHDGAHELKTAAAVLRSSVQVLDMKPRTVAEYHTGLERVLSDSERLEDLIARMLLLARYQSSVPTETADIGLGKQTEVVVHSLRTYAESRGVRVALAQEADAKVNLSDEAARTLISNLVMNAIQYSRPGGDVRVTVTEHRAREAILVVDDTGTGIAPENLPHVFDRFYREDISRSRQTGGAGLGLSICKSIVESAGGSIGIDSKQGKGTRVTVRLNLV
jgi:signal transduction histidine kinase